MRDNFTTAHAVVVRPHKSESAFVRYHWQNPYLQEIINVGRVDTVDRETNDNYCASQLVQEVVRGGRMQGAVTTNNKKRLRDSAMSGNDFFRFDKYDILIWEYHFLRMTY